MSDKETLAVYDAKVEDYAAMVTGDKPDPALVTFLGAVKPGEGILDLGCGVGNASAIMREAGFEVDAVDASLSMVEFANKTYNIGAVQKSFDDLTVKNFYDGIWANFSLLHASREDFPKHLMQVAQAIKPTGIFHIGMKLGTAEARDSIGRHYAYYSEAELRGYLLKNKFEVIETSYGEEAGLSGETSPWITILARSFKT